MTITPATVPGAPTIGWATRGNGSASVPFTPPASDGGSPITSYTATSNPGNITGTVSGSGGPITVTGLTNGTTYTFTVHATNAVGNGPKSAASNPVTPATVPGAPTIGSATAGDASATVSFTPPASDGGSNIGYYTAVSSPGGITASGSSPITVSGLTNGTTYTFTVYATNAVGKGPPSAPSNPVTPSATPFLAVSDVTVAEGNSATKVATFTVSRFGNTSGASSVKYKTVNGTAIAPGDYTALAPLGPLSFAAGQTTKTVNVSVKGDVVVEPDEAFTLELSEPVGATIFDPSGTATIQNDDSDAPPTFSINDVAVSEGNSGTKLATFTISRAGSTAKSASVKYKTANGTAVAPGDYTAAAPLGAVSFAIGETTKTVNITVKGDLLAESDETFDVLLHTPVGATVADPTGTGTITNDDPSATPSFSVNDVSVFEGHSLTKTMTFTITRSGNLAAASSVKYATANGSAVAPGDYTAKALTTVSFSAGQSTKTVAVAIKGERLVEPDETFTLNLSAPSAGTTISDGVGTGTIWNDD